MEAASSLCWVGLFLGRLRRWQLSCRLFPCRISPQILCSSHSTTSLRQSSCQRDPNPCPSTLCILHRFFLFVFVPLHFVKSFLPFLAVLCALSFALALARHAFALAFALAGLAFGFVVRARPSTRWVVLQVFSFFFDNLSPCGHTMNSFLRTFDLGCPSRTNPSEQAVCFFVSIQRFQSLSQISSILSCLQC